MSKVIKKVLTLLMVFLLMLGAFAGCGKKGSSEKPTVGEGDNKPEETKPKVITIGSGTPLTNPNYVDPLTGNTAGPLWKAGGLKAIDECKKQLNVEIKYVKYPTKPTEDILKSVLANDPICDIGVIDWGLGTVIGQNVLQNLDKYEDEFKEPEYSWMMPGKIYGHHYSLNEECGFTSGDVLIYNISYLQKIDTLKENGKTVLPIDLWKQGKWTWSAFEDYLKKTDTYYSTKKSPITQVPITAFSTFLPTPILSAITSNGGCIFGEKGMGVDTPEVKKAAEYIDGLYSKELLNFVWPNKRVDCMKNGETVFTQLAEYYLPKAAAGLTERGESMGLVPFPRPDDLAADDPRYQQLCSNTGNIGILKGHSQEQTDLAMKVYKLYFSTLSRVKKDCDSVDKFFKDKESAKKIALTDGLDVLNEDYGDKILEAFMTYNPTRRANEYYSLTNWRDQWDLLARNSVLGTDGSPKYETAIATRKQEFQDSVDKTSGILNSSKIVDNIAPSISLIGKDIAIAKGTDAKSIDWSKYLKAADNIDGDIDIKNVEIDTSKIVFDTEGLYQKALLVSVKDKEGNKKDAQLNVVIYNPNNKEAPTLVAKEKYREVKLNEDASKIKWGNDFVDKATSAEGLDLKAYVTADISSLDVTKGGKYDVTLTVTDYAGNKTDLKIPVTVSSK